MSDPLVGRTGPGIDIGTIRETLAYMRDDLRAAPNLAKVGSALEAALAEIDAVSAARAPASTRAVPAGLFPVLALVPWAPADGR